jgi:hypothetical protein
MSELPAQTIEQVERAVYEQPDSKQPHFKDSTSFFLSTLNWVTKSHLIAPPYSGHTRQRDNWLINLPKLDPFLAGVVYSVVAIDKNRGWSVMGGRNQVRRFSDILYYADGGAGWREFIDRQAQSFYCTDLGTITEIARRTENPDAPIGALYHVDSTRCVLTGKSDEPLEYTPHRGTTQRWKEHDFWRSASLVSSQEQFNRAGYCAVSRVLDMATLAIGLVTHDQEQLGLAIPAGYMIANGVSEQAWKKKMEEFRAERQSRGEQFSNEVIVLFGEEGEIKLDFVSLSQVPSHLKLDEFVNIMMQVYALCFGYDVNEFWNVRTGALGIGALSLVQSEKASAKGELDFVQTWQANIQHELPETIEFTFDERGDGGDQLRAETAERVQKAITGLYESGLQQSEPLISRDEARILLAEAGVIPRSMLEGYDEMEATDVVRARYEAKYRENIIRAAERFPEEPIIRKRHDRSEAILYPTGEALIHRRSYPVKPREVLHEENGIAIETEDVKAALKIAAETDEDFVALLKAKLKEAS